MVKDTLLVLSVGRVIADSVPVEPVEAYAILQHVHQHLRASRDDDGAIVQMPSLDAMGLTAFGDFEVRRAPGPAPHSVRPPHAQAHELATLLVRLVTSGRTVPDVGTGRCLTVAERALAGRTAAVGQRPIVTPQALFTALEAFRPRDASAALAGLYARWMRLTDSGQFSLRTAPTPEISFAPIADITPPGPTTVAPERRAPVEPLQTTLRLTLEPGQRPRAAMPPMAPVAPTAPPPPSLSARAEPPMPLIRDTPHAALGTISTHAGARRGRRLPAVSAVAMTALLAAGVVTWSQRTRVADAAPASTTTLEDPSSFIAPAAVDPGATSHTEVEVATVAARSGLPRDQSVRVRPLLRADRVGRPPYSPSFDPRTHALVFHAGLEQTSLLEASLRDDGSVAHVNTVRADGSRAYHVQVSPDGTRIAFDSDSDGTRGVYVANRDGSSPRRVSGAEYASVPSWSPDGESIAFARAEPGRSRVWNIWTVHLRTGALRRETQHRVGQPWGASWFPDGRRIAYSREDELVIRDLTTGDTRVFRTPVAGHLVRTPAVSPEGDRIVYQVHRDGAWVLDVARGESRRLLTDKSAQEFAWAPDGRRVAYHSVRGGGWGIWMMELGS